MKNIIFFLKLQKKTKIISIIVLLVLGTILDLFGLSIIIPTIKVISDYQNINLLLNNNLFLKQLVNFNQNELIVIFLFTFLIINIVKGLIFIYLSWKTNEFSKNINQELSKRLIEHYSKISYEEMIEKTSGTLIRNITQEVDAVSAAVLNFLNMVVDLFVMTSIFLFILYIEPGGVVIISLVLLIGLFIYRRIIVKKLISWGFERQRFFLKKVTNINEIFHSYSELKILKKINFFGKNYMKFNEQYYNNIIKYSITQVAPRFLVESLAVIGVVAALIYLIILIGDQKQILYALAVLGASALRLLPSLNRVINLYNSFKFSSAALELIRIEYFELNKFKYEKINKIDLSFSKSIEINNVSYNYPNNETYVVKNIYLKINKNDIIGIKGQTGSGKSTLLKILLGLIKPKTGEVKIDDIDLYKNNLTSEWFDKIAYVPQEIYLLNDTIKKNILFGLEDPEIDEDLYQLSLEYSNCNEFIKNHKNGDRTVIGENGLKLSGGQRQRIGIARAIYLNRQILIFDEATNSLDENTEKKIFENILRMSNRPTIIFVSHKSSNFDICDKIYDLKSQKKNLI